MKDIAFSTLVSLVPKRDSRSTAREVNGGPLGVEGVRAQLEGILANRIFARSARLIRFLRFSVQQALTGNGECLKEQNIGIEVFDRKPDYDPRIDPIVRVEARRLRSKLEAYYASDGHSDRLLIELPKGAYVPVFRLRATKAPKRPFIRPPEKSIVVLPFTKLTSDAGDDYFNLGLTEELIYFLTCIPHFRVIAWETASHFPGRREDLADIPPQLKIRWILRGSVRRLDGRVRVNAWLIDAKSGAYLWREGFERQFEDIFAMQQQIAGAIADTVEKRLQRSTATSTKFLGSSQLDSNQRLRFP
jgi:TolB-like protein